ncbi:hypothetical protein HPB52_003620 [Rhipicephalus sanguineus]|uniref:Uncharacterized protein n=1 Tax=Rhipicephalus sanguineus TaxID=34632 RepID=A0A9D4PU04_RHISA|nr:hypothetical protein HPB52_003620 [Rhipicephalus sanguineus]
MLACHLRSLNNPLVLITVIAVSICRARTFAFCIRAKELPPDVNALFGGYYPSVGHGVRVCRILRSEGHRQERTYRDALFVQLQQSELRPGIKKRRWSAYCDRIDHTADNLSSQALNRLRAQRPVKSRHAGVVHICSDVLLPDYVRKTLAFGPKFGVRREESPPELLSMVRSVASRASTEDSDRCVTEGVDVLLREAFIASIAESIYRTSKAGREREQALAAGTKSPAFSDVCTRDRTTGVASKSPRKKRIKEKRASDRISKRRRRWETCVAS